MPLGGVLTSIRNVLLKEDRLAFGVWPTVTLAQARAKREEAQKLLVQGIHPKAEQKKAQAENSGHMLSKLSLANGMQVISAGVKTIDRAFYAILSFISSLISVRPTFACSKPVTF